MKHISMLDLKSEYEYMKEEITNAIKRCLEHQKWILGPEVKKLEMKISEYLGVKHCVAISSGTDALVLSLRALAIKTKGREFFDRADKIITTPFTFIATVEAILQAGATPVFVDIDPATFNINASKIEEYLQSRNGHNVVGIIPVHLFGQSCNMDKIKDIAGQFGLFIVEDTAQAFGGMWKEKKLGSIGEAGCFSFFPSKNLGGFGDGGMIATDDDEIEELVRMLLNHGEKEKFNVKHIGYNARLDTIQASILLAKLKYVDEFNERRRKIASIYNQALSKIDELSLPEENKFSHHVFHQYTLRVLNGKRDALRRDLKSSGISTMIYYPEPLHRIKIFKDRSETSGDLKESERASQEVLSLPIEPLYNQKIIEYIISSIIKFFKN